MIIAMFSISSLMEPHALGKKTIFPSNLAGNIVSPTLESSKHKTL